MAGVEYITDPDGRSIRWHYERGDRPYKTEVGDAMFKRWAVVDQWADRREQYWTEVETRVLDKLQDQIFRDRLRELNSMQEDRSYLEEWLRPLRDAKGNVQRYPMVNDDGTPHQFAGLPKFPLKMPSIDRFLKALLDLDERIMLKRGEAITRTQTIGEKTKVMATALDPVGSLMNLSREEARKLAQNLLRERMGERYEGVLDLIEGDATDGGGTEDEDL